MDEQQPMQRAKRFSEEELQSVLYRDIKELDLAQREP